MQGVDGGAVVGRVPVRAGDATSTNYPASRWRRGGAGGGTDNDWRRTGAGFMAGAASDGEMKEQWCLGGWRCLRGRGQAFL